MRIAVDVMGGDQDLTDIVSAGVRFTVDFSEVTNIRFLYNLVILKVVAGVPS